MKKILWGLVLIIPLAVWAGGNPGNPYREFTVEDTVKWVLRNVEFAYNEGLIRDIPNFFSPNYSDVNGVTFNGLRNLCARFFIGSEKNNGAFFSYNASARINRNQAVLTATILLRPIGDEAEQCSMLIVKDTIVLNRIENKWLITSAPRLTSAFKEILKPDSLHTPNSQGDNDAY